MRTITICGGGSLGHVIAGWISAKNKANVNILTNHPDKWSKSINVFTPDGNCLKGNVSIVSNNPQETITYADVVLLCVPGFLIADMLIKIKPYLHHNTYVGSVFSSTGFFFEAIRILDNNQPLWGFQRVPFISRIVEYGSSANILGFKDLLKIAIEHVTEEEKDIFSNIIQDWFERPIKVLSNYYEVSLTNSNPLLHTSRLYSLFGGKNEGKRYSRMIMFYEEWTEEAADLLIKMDKEFFSLLKVLPVSENYLPTILDYYESTDAKSLAKKISSIAGFKGITSPMRFNNGYWSPDYNSRYFTEDFPFGLKFIWSLAKENHIIIPNIDLVYNWGINKIEL